MSRRIRAALTPQEWKRAGALTAAIVGLHALGFGLLFAAVIPRHLHLAHGVFGLGIGITAYTLGLRHAFDADHIGAIDNTTRKLINDGQRPLSVGFFFSLGHSTVVFALGLLVSIGVRGAVSGSAFQKLVGPLVSGSFLLLIGILNLVVLVGLVRCFGHDADLERRLESRGLLNRFYSRAGRAVGKPWQMYPVGLLFGLGFDTATEVALLVLAGAGAAGGLPFYAILCLPVLFAAGMSLFDTLDGAFMNFAYGWAFANPIRKAFYNLTITGLSVAVALVIGGLELASVLADRLRLSGGVWDFAASVDLNAAGYAIAALFAATWAVALVVWRLARLDERSRT